MKQHLFKGTGVALITPFKNSEIDYPALERIINFVIEEGVDFIVSLGTTGEAITLSAEECRAVLDFTIEKVDDRLPIVAGLFGSNYTDKLVKGIQRYNFDGIAAIMSSSPAYSKPSQEGIYQHYMRAAEVCPVPIIIYNVPGRTSSNIHPETTLRLAEASKQFIAVKEASGDLVQAMQIIRNRPADFLVLSGEDPVTLPIIACGGDGAISVIANVFPKIFSEMVTKALSDDLEAARKLNNTLLDVHPWLYVDGNPPGIKAALSFYGLCQNELRVPLTPMALENYKQLTNVLSQVMVPQV